MDSRNLRALSSLLRRKSSNGPRQPCLHFDISPWSQWRKELHGCVRLGLATSGARKILYIVGVIAMKCPLAAFVAMSALLLSACHAEPASSGAPAAYAQASGPAVTSSVPSAAGSTHAPDQTSLLDAKLDKGMAYSEFRKIVLDRGWTPKPDDKCKANVVGGDYKTWCPAHPGDAMCKV